MAEQLGPWIDQLNTNMLSGNLAIHNKTKWDPATWPAEASGSGTTEAPTRRLGHWVHVKNGKIENYQAIVATIWNGSPRDPRGHRGAWEEALIGTPIADWAKPVEILRTVHSFDPCMACAVHVVDAHGTEVHADSGCTVTCCVMRAAYGMPAKRVDLHVARLTQHVFRNTIHVR